MSIASQCPDEGALRAYLDGEMAADNRAALDTHLASCQQCTDALASLRRQSDLVYTALANMPAPRPATAAAWHRFRARQAELEMNAFAWRVKTMWQSLRYRHWRSALGGAVLVALLVTVMAVDPLRAAAAQFLGIFRVQKLTVVQIAPNQMNRLQSFQQQVFGEPQVSKGTKTQVNSAQEAGKLAGFDVLSPGYLPPQTQTRSEFAVEGARTAKTEVNVAEARSLLTSAGLPTDALPTGVDRVTVSASIPASVMMEYQGGGHKIAIIQARSPQVDVPNGIDMARLGDVGLRLLGMPADQASRMSQSIDWATTLVVPVPTDVGEVQQVPVHGTTGYLVSSADDAHPGTVVFWESNGVLYAVAGDVRASALAQVAESLK